MREENGRATADSWQTQPMPWRVTLVRLNIRVPLEDFRAVEMGHIPQEMEDHWFMYCADGHIRWYRSWTGMCVFDATYKVKGDVVTLRWLAINRKGKLFRWKERRCDTNIFLALMAQYCKQ